MHLVRTENISKHYKIHSSFFSPQGKVVALDNVSLEINSGDIVALVGESGSGKSTLGRILQGLIAPTSGEVFFENKNAATLSRQERAAYAQTLFQDPYSSLNPSLKIKTILKESLRARVPTLAEQECRDESQKILQDVGLTADALNEYPHAFSGGQRQRIGIARALAMRPKLLICDEPVSALDVSVEAQILNLLSDIAEEHKMTLLIITHDLGLVRQLANFVFVLEAGKIVEREETEQLFKNPKAAMTQKLIQSELSF